MHVCLNKVSGPVEWCIVHANTLKVTRARMEHSLHSYGLPLTESSGQNALINSSGSAEKRLAICDPVDKSPFAYRNCCGALPACQLNGHTNPEPSAQRGGWCTGGGNGAPNSKELW